jgi:tRNA threonylcarbamoyladenosine modification (KEOPS) complex  Pcc1 subunit
MSHKIKCTILFYYDQIDPAIILGATSIDNYDYVFARLEGKKLICEISSETVNSMLSTINDLLSAIKLAKTIYTLR